MFKFFSVIIISYLICLMLFCVILNIIENKIPETHPFKKWWRKHIVTNEIED